MDFQSPRVILPSEQHEYTVILLHGRGSNGEEFAQELFEGKCSDGSSILDWQEGMQSKWIFPHAQERMSTVFQEELTEWFDIYSLSTPDADKYLQLDGLRESVEYIQTIIEEELLYMSPDKIILGGSSQGFAVASHVLLSGHYRLRGLLGFSGWLPLRSHLRRVTETKGSLKDMYDQTLGMADAHASTEALKTPVFITHSADDSIVDIKNGREARDLLVALGL